MTYEHDPNILKWPKCRSNSYLMP
uniref:Uncharacterized protein n=1 Tax=Arundo donax TaxID=35708 RepID=A0A0A9C741_ARUDO